MKIPAFIKGFLFPVIITVLIVSCNSGAEKKDSDKSDKKSEQTKSKPADTSVMDKPVPGAGDDKNAQPAPGKNQAAAWKVDAAKAAITFDVSGPFGTVHGSFGGLKATIFFDEKKTEGSSFNASVDVKTISTGVGLRNSDLQKEKWFDSDKYPTISFKSQKVEKAGSGYKAVGNLTMKGVTHPLELPFSFSNNIFHGQITVNRNDYGVGKSGGGVGSTVSIKLEVPVTK